MEQRKRHTVVFLEVTEQEQSHFFSGPPPPILQDHPLPYFSSTPALWAFSKPHTPRHLPLPIQVTHFHGSYISPFHLYLSTKPIPQFQRKTFNWLCCSLKNTILPLLSFTGNVDKSVCFLFFLLLKSSLEFSDGSLPQVLPLLLTLAYFSLPCWVLSRDPGPVMEHCNTHNGPLTGSF